MSLNHCRRSCSPNCSTSAEHRNFFVILWSFFNLQQRFFCMCKLKNANKNRLIEVHLVSNSMQIIKVHKLQGSSSDQRLQTGLLSAVLSVIWRHWYLSWVSSLLLPQETWQICEGHINHKESPLWEDAYGHATKTVQRLPLFCYMVLIPASTIIT